MYLAIVLNEKSINLIKSTILKCLDLNKLGFVFETDNKTPLPHHMTINLGSYDKELNPNLILNSEASMEFNEIFIDKILGVCAIPVSNIMSNGMKVNVANSKPHVTCCIKPGSKPKFSNDMLENPTYYTIIVKCKNQKINGLIEIVN